MAHLYETLLSKDINYYVEYNKIYGLFNEEFRIAFAEYVSLKSKIDDDYFSSLKIRANMNKVDDFFELISNFDNKEMFFQFSEFLLTIKNQLVNKMDADFHFLNEQFDKIIEIIKFDLDILCLDVKYIENKILGTIAIIVPKSEKLEKAVECIDDPDIKQLLIKYASRNMQGDISEKERILSIVSKYIEPLTKNHELQSSHKRLVDDTSFLQNNMNIRHNNKVINDTRFYEATKKDREHWLDLIYDEFLLLIIAETEDENHNEIINLKKQILGE